MSVVRRNRPARQAPRRRRGFTLLEVLIVLAIIGVIAAMVAPNLLSLSQQASIDAARGSIKRLDGAVSLYAVHNKSNYPENLNNLTEKAPDGSAALFPTLPKDPWGNDFMYEWPNTKGGDTTKPALWSPGPNGQDENGGGDDVNNWDVPEDEKK